MKDAFSGQPASSAPVNSSEAVLARIASRAVGGKVAILKRGERHTQVVTLHPDADAATCTTINTAPDDTAPDNERIDEEQK